MIFLLEKELYLLKTPGGDQGHDYCGLVAWGEHSFWCQQLQLVLCSTDLNHMASVSFSRLPNCEHAAGRQHHLQPTWAHHCLPNPTFILLDWISFGILFSRERRRISSWKTLLRTWRTGGTRTRWVLSYSFGKIPLSQRLFVNPILVPGSEVWSEASRRRAPWSWGQEGEEIDLNIWQNLTLCLWFYTLDTLCLELQVLTILDLIFSEKPNPTCTNMQNEAGEYVDMYIPRCVHKKIERKGKSSIWDVLLLLISGLQEVQCLQQDLVC